MNWEMIWEMGCKMEGEKKRAAQAVCYFDVSIDIYVGVKFL